MSRHNPRSDQTRREPGREPSGANRQGRPRLNEFFVDGAGIHREVMQREICKFLGPEAYSKPHSYNGIQGYLVSAIRPFTRDQLDDLEGLSEAYEKENRQMRRQGHPAIQYQDSETSRRQEAVGRHIDSTDMMDESYYHAQQQYPAATSQQGYPALTSSYVPPLGGAYPGSAYATDPGYPPSSTYPPGYPSSSSSRQNDNYTYQGNESPRNDPYRQPTGYQPRPNQGRMPDQREPPRPDPRYAQRGDPRSDPRTMQQPPAGYGYSSAADIGPGYVYAPPPPPSQSGRGIDPYAPPRASPYDPYRNEPVRDVRNDMRDDGRRPRR